MAPARAAGPPGGRRRSGSGLAGRAVRAAVAAYFDVAYRLLDSTSGRAFLHATAGDGIPETHSYATAEDLDVIVDALRPTPEETLLDLGSGLGEVAIEIHRRTGCRIVGVDASRRAVATATRRAAAAGVGAAVRFVTADLADMPAGASGAYALDSLMFLPDPIAALAALTREGSGPGRIVATLVDFRATSPAAIRDSIERAGLRVVLLHDVTAGLATRSAARRRAATALLRTRPARVADLLGLLMVVAEERLVGWRLRRGRIRRWRLVVERPSPDPLEAR